MTRAFSFSKKSLTATAVNDWLSCIILSSHTFLLFSCYEKRQKKVRTRRSIPRKREDITQKQSKEHTQHMQLQDLVIVVYQRQISSLQTVKGQQPLKRKEDRKITAVENQRNH